MDFGFQDFLNFIDSQDFLDSQDSLESLDLLVLSLKSLGKLNEAIEFYGVAIDVWEETLQRGEVRNLPNLAICLGNLIFAHRKAGNTNLAEKDLRRLHELLEFNKQHKEIEHLG